MSEETERKSNKLTLGIEELQALIATSVAEAVKQSSATFANALLEARKPYVDPRVAENDKAMRDSFRIAQTRMNEEIDNSRKFCQHKQGSNALSEFQGQMGSFVLHQLDTGAVVGICTNCQKTIWSNTTDPEELKLFGMKNGNRMSAAGQRVFRDPVKAQAAR